MLYYGQTTNKLELNLFSFFLLGFLYYAEQSTSFMILAMTVKGEKMRNLSDCPRKCIVGGYINNGLIVTVKELNRSKTRSFFHIIGFYCYPYNFLVVVLGWIHIIHLHDIALH